MNIISTNILNDDQYNEIQTLINSCKENDNIEGVVFLEADMNDYESFPCFQLLYEDGILVSFLSVFIPFEEECEIYAYTSPQHRKNGYFKRLFQIARKNIIKYDIGRILIVAEPQSSVCPNVMASINAKYENSDYMLKYNTEITPEPQNTLAIKSNKKHYTEVFETSLSEKKVGECKVDHAHGSMTIYDFELIKKWRGKGYGKETLLLVLKNLLKDQNENIVLHINSDNKIALNMYLKNGFVTSKQIDYWKVI